MAAVSVALKIAQRQYGVVSRAQLAKAGLTRHEIDNLISSGSLRPVHRGVFTVASAPESREQGAIAACLVAPHVAVSHTTAAALWGYRGFDSVREIHVVVLKRAAIKTPGLVIDRTEKLRASDVRRRSDGIRLTAPMMTVFTLASFGDHALFEQAVEDGIHLKHFTMKTLAQYWSEHRARGRDGSGALDALLVTRPAGGPGESGLEIRMLRALRRAGLPDPRRQLALSFEGGERIRVDLAYPDARIAIECDGSWWHGGDLKSRADKRRDTMVAAHGWLPVRVADGSDLDEAARSIAAAYRIREPLARLWRATGTQNE